MSYRSWLGCPHLALSTLDPRAASARGEAEDRASPAPRASTLIFALTVAISALALAVDFLLRLAAAT